MVLIVATTNFELIHSIILKSYKSSHRQNFSKEQIEVEHVLEKYSFINISSGDIGIMKCVQFFSKFPALGGKFSRKLEHPPVPGRTWSRFSFENRERNLCGVSAARLSRIHSNWMNPLSVVRPHNTLLSPVGRGRCFLPRSNFPVQPNICNPKINEIYTINYLSFRPSSILPI